MNTNIGDKSIKHGLLKYMYMCALTLVRNHINEKCVEKVILTVVTKRCTYALTLVQSGGLEVHVCRYTGDKLCKCDTCGTQFSSSGAFKTY